MLVFEIMSTLHYLMYERSLLFAAFYEDIIQPQSLEGERELTHVTSLGNHCLVTSQSTLGSLVKIDHRPLVGYEKEVS